MSNALPIEDLSKTYLEHSMVINNFVIKIGSQIKDSLCRVFGDGVQYEWHSPLCDGSFVQCHRRI